MGVAALKSTTQSPKRRTATTPTKEGFKSTGPSRDVRRVPSQPNDDEGGDEEEGIVTTRPPPAFVEEVNAE